MAIPLSELDHRAERAEIGRRLVTGISIDPLKHPDIEQVTWVERCHAGWLCLVTVPDVGVFVPPGSPADRQAKERMSTQFPEEGQPVLMLPGEITYDQASLTAGLERPSITVALIIEPDGKCVVLEIYLSQVLNQRQYSYDEASLVLNDAGLPEGFAAEQLAVSMEAARAIYRGICITEPRRTKGFDYLLRDKPSEFLVNCLMTATNNAVAGYCQSKGIPVIYGGLSNTVTPDRISPQRDDLVRACLDHRIQEVEQLRRSYLISFRGQVYSTQPENATNGMIYMQVTAPLRRSVDMTNWQQIRAHLTGQPYPWDLDTLQVMAERLSVDKMTAVDDYSRLANHLLAGGKIWDYPNLGFVLKLYDQYDYFGKIQDWVQPLADRLAGGAIVALGSLARAFPYLPDGHPLKEMIADRARAAGKPFVHGVHIRHSRPWGERKLPMYRPGGLA